MVIDLERGQYYKNRKTLMKPPQIPKLSTAVKHLGEALSNVVFEQCEEALRDLWGLIPPLQGPGNELWVSPSDLLIGKVCLKPPLTSKHIQALTHQGILEIGKKVEEKYWREMEKSKENALIEQKDRLDKEFQHLLKLELKKLQIEERLSCGNRIKDLCVEFDAILTEAMLNIEYKLIKKHALQLKLFKHNFKIEYEKTQKEQLDKKIQEMAAEFIINLKSKEAEMKQNFVKELRKIELDMKHQTIIQRQQYEISLNRLQHSLECKNLANIMCILCMERRKCTQEKNELALEFKKEMSKLEILHKENTQKITTLTQQLEKNLSKLHIREACLRELIRQYQKFINFALRSVPTQAEFLLSLEHLLLYELTETINMSKEQFSKPCPEIKTWSSEEISETEFPHGLTLDDGHNCLDEVSLKDEKSEKDFLPAFHYKENLYLREDFRNMLSNGLEIRPSNELWNKELDILMRNYNASKLSSKKTSLESVTKKTKSLLKNPEDVSAINHENVGTYERRGSILASRSSVELIRLKCPDLQKTVHTEEVTEESNTDLEDKFSSELRTLKPSHIIDRSSVWNDAVRESSVQRFRSSKIVQAKDSLIFKLSKRMKPHKQRCQDSLEITRDKMRTSISLKPTTLYTSDSSSRSSCTCFKRNSSPCETKTRPQVHQAMQTEIRHSIRLSRKKTVSSDIVPEALLKIYKPQIKAKDSHVERLVTKRNEAKIAGDLESDEYLQDFGEFTEGRVHSLVTLIKDKPDLIGLFTSVVR